MSDSQAKPLPQERTSSSVLDLDTIEREAEAATSAPWTVVSDRDKSAVYADGHAIIESENHHATPGWQQQRGGVVRTWDADFIASARTNVPALCKELREARAEIERLESVKVMFPHGLEVADVRNLLAKISEKDAEIERLGDEVASLRSGAAAQEEDLAAFLFESELPSLPKLREMERDGFKPLTWDEITLSYQQYPAVFERTISHYRKRAAELLARLAKPAQSAAPTPSSGNTL